MALAVKCPCCRVAGNRKSVELCKKLDVSAVRHEVPESASNLPASVCVCASDGVETVEECNEATASAARVWSGLSEFPAAVAGGECASVDGGVATTGEFGRPQCQAQVKAGATSKATTILCPRPPKGWVHSH